MPGFQIGDPHKDCRRLGVLRAEFDESGRLMFLRCDACQGLVQAARQRVTRAALCAESLAGVEFRSQLRPSPTACPTCQSRGQRLQAVYLRDERDDPQAEAFFGIDCLFCDHCSQVAWAASRQQQREAEEADRRKLTAIMSGWVPPVPDALNKP